jgi:hypothetical protein
VDFDLEEEWCRPLDEEEEEWCEDRWDEDMTVSVEEVEVDRVIRLRSGSSIVMVGMSRLDCSSE